MGPCIRRGSEKGCYGIKASLIMPTISIIVPVYNTEQYLSRCLDSILNQSFTDFELLLIDDGSKDGSEAICDECAKKDNRIRVFHKENGGVSSARNLGLQEARGEWLFFVDSDDEVMPNGLQTLVDGISADVDVVMGGFEEIGENGMLIESIDGQGETIILSKKESLSSLYHGHALGCSYLGWMCLRLFRKEIIQRERILFDTSIAIKEDTLFEAQYLCKSNGVTRFVKKPVYKYYMRNNSAMGGWRHGFDYKYVDSFYALIKMRCVIKKCSVYDSELAYITKEGIWRRYDDIKSRLKSCGCADESLLKRLRCDLYKEGAGFSFLVSKKLKKIRKKWWNRV